LLGKAGVDPLDVEVDRLLAQHGLAGPCRGNDEIDMRIGRRRDENRADLRVGESAHGIRHGRGAMTRGQSLRRGRHDVDHGFEPRARMRRDIARVQRADAPGAEEAEVQHDRRRRTTMTERASADCRSRPLIFSA
jgi:hypothetical protein